MPLEDAIRSYPQSRRFEVVRMLGAGGMGVVYEAFDRERNSRIALKTLRTLDAEARLRFKREFRALQDIQHPNLVSLGELLEENGQIFFTMELVEGVEFIEYVRPRTLQERISAIPQPVEETLASPGAQNRSSAPPARATMRPTVGSTGTMPPPRRTSSMPPRATTPPPPPRPTMRPSYEPGGDLTASVIREKRTPWNWLVRNGTTFDEARLRASFAQLARGIQALHQAQKVHRDIKPSNVLVTEQGRVVLLDFGLIADVERDERDPTQVVGTAHFMAPEQAAARDVGPEADWYSMGSMLYLALTGYYPFQLAPEVVLDFKQCVEPTPPGLFVDDLPPDLESLCIDLLRLDPKARPTGQQVLSRLHVEEAREDQPLSSYAATFIGRWTELEALDLALADARSGASVAVLIEGESGMGKSALLRRFIDQFSGDALIFAGRCYERESVPYKAVDEIIDALAQHLGRLPREEVEAILPANAGLLGSIFPVLQKIGSLAERPRESGELRDPLEVRFLVFTALREILGRLAERRTVVIAIDDLQWADADGLALLAGVMRPPDPPPILLVATHRSEASAPRGDRQLQQVFEGAIRSLKLGPLPEDEARQLAKLLIRTARPRRAPGEPAGPVSQDGLDLDAIVREAAGHPLFIDALVRHRIARGGDTTPVRLDDALWGRIQRLDAAPRRLLELVAVAGGPVRTAAASHALSADLDDLSRLAAILRVGNLVRTGGAGQVDIIETFHDRIRETVVSRIDPEATREWHGKLARALEAEGGHELERLAAHWLSAGDASRALGYTMRAADQAAAALAFDQAAKLYRSALDLSVGNADAEHERALLARLADALAHAGQNTEAADIYLSASALALEEDDALELQRRAAENYLRSGYVDEGMACLRTVLTAIDMEVPETPQATQAALIFRRTELKVRGLAFEERRASDLTPHKLIQIELCWSAALGLGMVDHVRGAYFQTRNVLLSLKAGEPYRIARALALEATFVSTAGVPVRARVAELLAAAQGAAEQSGQPHAIGLLPTCAGLAAFFEGRFREALSALDRGEAILRDRCANVSWERRSALSYAAFCLWFLGDLRSLAKRVPMHLREAEERGDRYFAAHLRSGTSNAVWLLRDDPAEALRQAEKAINSWSKAGFHLQHFYDMVARAQIALYRGDGEAAHRYVVDRWAALEASMHLRIQVVRVSAVHLRARTALASARAAHPSSAALLDLAGRAARELEAEEIAWAEPLGAMIRAGIAAARADMEGAQAWLAKAMRGFRSAQMDLYAAAAKRRFGEISGGEKGAAMVAEADRWMIERGVARPDRITEMLAPGL